MQLHQVVHLQPEQQYTVEEEMLAKCNDSLSGAVSDVPAAARCADAP